MARGLAKLILRHLVPDGIVHLAGDDTVDEHRGEKVFGKGRDHRVELAALIDEATQLRAILGKSIETARSKARERSDRQLVVAPTE